MYRECHATVGETFFGGEEHIRDIKGIRCEVVCCPWVGHTQGIGVGALAGLMSECEPFEEVDSVHTYVEYLV